MNISGGRAEGIEEPKYERLETSQSVMYHTSGAPKVHAGLISMPMIRPHPRTSDIISGNFAWSFLARPRSCGEISKISESDMDSKSAL